MVQSCHLTGTFNIRKTRCCHCSILRPQKCIPVSPRKVTPQGGWFLCLCWLLSQEVVPLSQAGMSKRCCCSKAHCTGSPQVSIQAAGGNEPVAVLRNTQHLCPKATLCNSLQAVHAVEIPAADCKLSWLPGDEFQTRWKKSISVCELEGGQQVLQSQSSL